ncbi:MAG: hypothetical protein WD696_18530 [Bryobacteraceae bacterium]
MVHFTVGPFSLDVPEAWTLSTVILVGPPPQQQPASGMLRRANTALAFQRNLIATMEAVSEAETPESYVDRQIRGLREAGVSQWEANEPEQVQLENGRAGLLTEQVVVGAGGEHVRQMQLVSIKNGVAYTVILSHLDGDQFDAVRDEFRGILLSFT